MGVESGAQGRRSPGHVGLSRRQGERLASWSAAENPPLMEAKTRGGLWRAALAQAPCSRPMNVGFRGARRPPLRQAGRPPLQTWCSCEAPCSNSTCCRALNREGSIGGFQSRRDCDPKPGVARHELPRGRSGISTNANGVAPARRNPVGVDSIVGTVPRVGPLRGPTLGFGTESRWDSWICVGRPPRRNAADSW